MEKNNSTFSEAEFHSKHFGQLWVDEFKRLAFKKKIIFTVHLWDDEHGKRVITDFWIQTFSVDSPSSLSKPEVSSHF